MAPDAERASDADTILGVVDGQIFLASCTPQSMRPRSLCGMLHASHTAILFCVSSQMSTATTPIKPPKSMNLPPLAFRAAVETIDEEARTVELVFTTGAAVERYDWWTGKRYIEKLSLQKGHIRLDRLNAGAPLLDAHSAWSIADQIGVVESGTVKLTAKEARVTVRFSKRDEVEPFFRDVVDGILKNVSVGYKVYRFEEDDSKNDKIPTRTATDWEPYEVSLVPMPADIGAQVRSHQIQSYQCEIVARGAASAPPEEPQMQNEQDTRQPELIIEQPIPPADAPTRTTPQEPSDRERGAEAERLRVEGILNAVTNAGLPLSFGRRLIADRIPLVDAQGQVLRELGERGGDAIRQSSAVPRIEMGESPLVHERAGIVNAILHRSNPSVFKLEDIGRKYRAMSLLRVAEVYLNSRGMRTTEMSRMDIAGVALGIISRGGMHTTSDFTDLLADVANKNLRAAYDQSPQTFKPIARQMTAPDFKTINLIQLGEAPVLEQVREHGEFKRGTVGDSKETFFLKTYGKIFAITRQAIVNDDLDAFSRLPMLFGRAALNLESDVVWAIFIANAVMADGQALFSTAHNNLQADGDQISVDSLSRGRASMRLQKGLDGVTLLNIVPKNIIVPATLETKAQQVVGVVTPQNAANVNPFSGLLQVIAEPRLDAASLTAWYLAAFPEQIDMVVYAYLEGQTGPTIETQNGFNVDGVELKARHDFAATIPDFRGLHKDPGELAS